MALRRRMVPWFMDTEREIPRVTERWILRLDAYSRGISRRFLAVSGVAISRPAARPIEATRSIS
jgi:hypothetical protein